MDTTPWLLDVNEEPDPGTLPEDLARRLAIFCDFNMPVGIVAQMLDAAGKKLPADDRRYLCGPIIVHAGGGWSEDIPHWMIDRIRGERFRIVTGEAQWLVGPSELACVMYGAMLEAPRGAELSDLYLWATVSCAAPHYGKPVEDYWTMLDCRPITDADVCEPAGRLWHHYSRLCAEVKRKVISEQHEYEREEARQEAYREQWKREAGQREQRQPVAVTKPPEPPKTVQHSLFPA